MFENVIPEIVNLALYDDDSESEAIVLTAVTEDCEIKDTIVTLEFICRAPLHRVLSAPMHEPFSTKPISYKLIETCEKIHETEEFCVLLFRQYNEKNELTCVKSTVCKFETLYSNIE